MKLSWFIAIACTVGVSVGDKVGVTDPDEHAAGEEARNLLKKKGKKTKRSKDGSVQQRDDALEATIMLLKGQIESQQEVIAVQQQELVDLKEESNTTSLLYVQIATNCELRQHEDGRFTAVANVGDDTYAFTDRPQRLEYNVLTADFVDMFSFNQTFWNDPPNAAITAVSNDSDQFGGPAVAILSNASVLPDGRVSYDITQSPDQSNELSLAPFFKTGSSVVQFTHCSIFIDSVFEKNQPVLVSELNPKCEPRMLSDFQNGSQNGEFFSSKNKIYYAGTWKFSPPDNVYDNYSCASFCTACASGPYDMDMCSADGTWSCKIYREFKSCNFEESTPYSEYTERYDPIGPDKSFTLDEGDTTCSTTYIEAVRDRPDRPSHMTIECKSDAYRGILYFTSKTFHYQLSILDEGTYTVDVPFSYDYEDGYVYEGGDDYKIRQITHCKWMNYEHE